MKKMLDGMNPAQLVSEDELEDLAELLNYPLREHKRMVEEHTDREVEIRTFSGRNLKQLFQKAGFETGMEKLALLLKEEIDKGHHELEEALQRCGSASQP